MLKDPEKIQSLVYAIDFFLCIERGRTAIRRLVKSGAPWKFLKHNLFLWRILFFAAQNFSADVRPKMFLWTVRDCAEFKNTYILHVTFIELSLSIIRGYCRRISFYWMVLPVKLKTYWIVQHFAGKRRWPIPFFAQNRHRRLHSWDSALPYDFLETSRLFPQSLCAWKSVGSYGQVTWLRNERLAPSFGAKPGRARSRGI